MITWAAKAKCWGCSQTCSLDLFLMETPKVENLVAIDVKSLPEGWIRTGAQEVLCGKCAEAHPYYEPSK